MRSGLVVTSVAVASIVSAGSLAAARLEPLRADGPAPATITGAVRGLPASSGLRFGSVLAFNGKTGELVTGGAVGRSLAYRLPVLPGAYMLFGSVADLSRRRAYAGSSHAFAAGSGTRRIDLTLRPLGRQASARSLQAARALAAPGTVVSIGRIPVLDASGATLVGGKFYRGMLITDVLNARAPCQFDVVADDPDEKAALEAELALQRSRFVDPSTRVRPNPLRATVRVEGSVRQSGSGDSFTGQLRVVDVRSGRSLGTASRSGSIFQLSQLLAGPALQLICAKFPIRYKILSVSFRTDAAGTITGGLCAMSGTRRFSGSMASQTSPPVSVLDKFPDGKLHGLIRADAAAEWTNDRLVGCKPTPTGLERCELTTPPRRPQPGGRAHAQFTIDVQAQSATLKGHWEVPGAEIGFVAGGPPSGDCLLVPYILFQLEPADTAKSYPLSTFTSAGPQTITFSGSKHFEKSQLGLETKLDYSWTYSIMLQRVR